MSFEAALHDPDSLAGVVRPGEEAEFWDFERCAPEVYRQLTGQERPYDPSQQYPPQFGESWDTLDDEEVERRMPRLYRLFDDEKG